MGSRRAFIKSLLIATPCLGLSHPLFSAPAPASRIALVIGNNRYQKSPLENPVNDARAMAALLNKAGFAVETLLDAQSGEFRATINRFVANAKRPETREAILYYAGHGAQLDWRNYLLPTDASISNPDDVKQRCIDLNQVLSSLPASQNKTYVILLDACRNNPFGKAYQPSQKGLSQFDAPPGTLIAFATGPGRVASDGEGDHGLYSQHLLQELAKPGVAIEEALKRVRLNVRLASEGEQIPWESTSLESSVFVVPNTSPLIPFGEPKSLDEELEQWNRIKTSSDARDWIAYLRQYPDGKFSEIAQVRLDQVLPPRAGTELLSTPLSDPRSPSINPFSAGRFPLGRRYAVGDNATYRVENLRSRKEGKTLQAEWKVTRVEPDTHRVELNQGNIIWDAMGNPVQPGKKQKFDVPAQYYPAELYVGRKWTSLVGSSDNDGDVTDISIDFSITTRETLTVPAGVFDCFRLDGKGTNSKGVRIGLTLWITPGLNFFVKREASRQFEQGRSWSLYELASLHQSQPYSR